MNFDCHLIIVGAELGPLVRWFKGSKLFWIGNVQQGVPLSHNRLKNGRRNRPTHRHERMQIIGSEICIQSERARLRQKPNLRAARWSWAAATPNGSHDPNSEVDYIKHYYDKSNVLLDREWLTRPTSTISRHRHFTCFLQLRPTSNFIYRHTAITFNQT